MDRLSLYHPATTLPFPLAIRRFPHGIHLRELFSNHLRFSCREKPWYCFHARNPLSIQPCKPYGSLYLGDKVEDVYAWVYNNDVRFLDTEPGGKTTRINTRRWVMQERILSHRVLHFGEKQIFGERNSFQASEAFRRAFRSG